MRVWFAVVVLLLVLPRQVPAESFSFSVTSDYSACTGPGTYDTPDYFRGVCEAIALLGPGDFMVSPGDIHPGASARWTIEQYIDSTHIWYPVVGNHDAERPQAMEWMRNYNAGGNTLPYVVNIGPTNCEETTFSFDYQNTHFVVLNEYYDGDSDCSTDGDVVDSLYYWLVDDLAVTSKPLVFVFGHEPAYPWPDAYNARLRHVGDSLDKYPVHRDRFWSLLRDEAVVAYICGHSHDYSAVKREGVWQLDVGRAGGVSDIGAPSTFSLIEVNGDNMADVTFTVYRDLHDGIYDYNDIIHTWTASADPEPPERVTDLTAALSEGIFLSWSPVTADTTGNPEGILYYAIHRDTLPDLTVNSTNFLSAVAGQAYLDSTAEYGNSSISYFYIILAVDIVGNGSMPSNCVGEFTKLLVNTDQRKKQ
jgi:hypothetical protein